MKTFYWTTRLNFGDLLTPLLIARFCYPLTATFSSAKDSQLIAVGSLLHHLDSSYTGVIAGTGSLYKDKKYWFPKAKILALRGYLTLNQVNPKGIIAIGDLGLLADELIPQQDRVYELGVVPHWSDTQLGNDPKFLQYNPLIIDVTQDPLKVITQIAQCKKIVASSLHAIILADAFFIPRRIELAPDMISNPYEGGDFKWRDYSSSIGAKFELGKTIEPSRNAITERQHELFDVLKEIKSLFSKDV